MKVVNKYIKVRIYPSKADNNDKGEKIVSINKIESNIGIHRFIYNHELALINYFKSLLVQHGYGDKVIVNDNEIIIKAVQVTQRYFSSVLYKFFTRVVEEEIYKEH